MSAYRPGSTIGVGLMLSAVIVLGATPAYAQEGDGSVGSAATVIPPTETPLGASYAEWGDAWWQWLLSIPPIEDPDVGDCQAGQGGEVFFIPHVPPGVAIATECTIGADQWILAAAGGTVYDNSDGSGLTSDDLAAMVEADIPLFSELAVTIDGEAVPDIESYWVMDPAFTLEYGEDNPYGLPAGTWDAAMGGWFVMIPPLEPGSHTIVVGDLIAELDSDADPLLAELTVTTTVE